MARKYKNNAPGILLIIVPVLLANWLSAKLGIPIWLTCTLLIPAAIAALFVYFAEQNRKFRAIQIANVDAMTGIDFERYLRKLLSTRGYSVSMTQASGDFGVDLIATSNSDKIAIQVKR